jgi:hypothetical protein
MNEYLSILVQLILFVSVLSSMLGMFLYQKMNVPNKYFVVYILTSTIIEFLAKSFAEMGINNLVFFHISVLLDFTILTLFFSHTFGIAAEKVAKWILAPVILLFLFNSLFVQTMYTYNSINLTLSGIYLLGCCLYYFYHTIDHQEDNIEITFTKYAVYSIFVIQSISIIVLFFGNTLLEMDAQKQSIIWNVRASIIFVVKIVILVEFIKIFKHFLGTKVRL